MNQRTRSKKEKPQNASIRSSVKLPTAMPQSSPQRVNAVRTENQYKGMLGVPVASNAAVEIETPRFEEGHRQFVKMSVQNKTTAEEQQQPVQLGGERRMSASKI